MGHVLRHRERMEAGRDHIGCRLLREMPSLGEEQ